MNTTIYTLIKTYRLKNKIECDNVTIYADTLLVLQYSATVTDNEAKIL
jgi:hypothetical protein